MPRFLPHLPMLGFPPNFCDLEVSCKITNLQNCLVVQAEELPEEDQRAILRKRKETARNSKASPGPHHKPMSQSPKDSI